MATIIAVRGCHKCGAKIGEGHIYECPDGRPFASKAPINKTDLLRPVLADFAIAMEAKLRKNDHKTGWRDLPIQAIFSMLMVEIEEFKIAHQYLSADEARKELIDIANFAMIMWDRISMEAHDLKD